MPLLIFSINATSLFIQFIPMNQKFQLEATGTEIEKI